MFKSQVCCYLKSLKVDVENDKRIGKMRLFVTPITYDLAAEASQRIADLLFHKNGGPPQPVLEMDNASFAIQWPEQSLEYRRSPDYPGHQVIIPGVKIQQVSAQKLIAGDSNFSLLFTASFEINDKSIVTDLVDLLHEKIYCDFAPMQPGLFDKEGGPVMNLLCRMCDAPEPEFATTDGQFAYCSKHKHQTQEGESIVRIRPDTAKAAAIADEMREPGDESENEERKDPLEEEAEFINKRNSRRRKKK